MTSLGRTTTTLGPLILTALLMAAGSAAAQQQNSAHLTSIEWTEVPEGPTGLYAGTFAVETTFSGGACLCATTTIHLDAAGPGLVAVEPMDYTIDTVQEVPSAGYHVQLVQLKAYLPSDFEHEAASVLVHVAGETDAPLGASQVRGSHAEYILPMDPPAQPSAAQAEAEAEQGDQDGASTSSERAPLQAAVPGPALAVVLLAALLVAVVRPRA